MPLFQDPGEDVKTSPETSENVVATMSYEQMIEDIFGKRIDTPEMKDETVKVKPKIHERKIPMERNIVINTTKLEVRSLNNSTTTKPTVTPAKINPNTVLNIDKPSNQPPLSHSSDAVIGGAVDGVVVIVSLVGVIVTKKVTNF